MPATSPTRWASALALAASGCADPPDIRSEEVFDVGRPGAPCGSYDMESRAWMTAAWEDTRAVPGPDRCGGRIEYRAFTTYRIHHGLGRVPRSVEVWASFDPTGNLAQQIGNVATIVPTLDGGVEITRDSILLRNGGGQTFYAIVVLR